MRIPIIRGVIDRRILVNFRVDPDVLTALVPEPFHPKLVGGFGIAGVCLIRLKQIRPRLLPRALGVSSENAAHRIAVEWEQNGLQHEGVFVPRRDTSSRLNTMVGGRLFPGVHHHARFETDEQGEHYRVALDSDDGDTHLVVDGNVAPDWPSRSVFPSLRAASSFFEAGSLGYSVTAQPGRFDGLELRCLNWSMTPLAVEPIESSYFDDRDRFPPGSIEFDSALLMRGIEHEWHGQQPICDWPAAAT
jgi:Uncharacterized conserved protein (COG2071)